MKNKSKVQYPKPQKFQPTREEELAIMEQIAMCLSENQVLISHQIPGLEVRGKIKNN
mgnify:CR=1 FL=1